MRPRNSPYLPLSGGGRITGQTGPARLHGGSNRPRARRDYCREPPIECHSNLSKIDWLWISIGRNYRRRVYHARIIQAILCISIVAIPPQMIN